MAVLEQWESRRIRETIYGKSIEQVFVCTWTDFDVGTFNYYVGDEWSSDWPEMRITDITMVPIDNVNVKMYVLYSTEGYQAAEPQRPNQIASWESSFDVTTEIDNVKRWWDYTTKTQKEWSDWTTAWVAGGGTEANAPPIPMHKPHMTYRVTAFSDKFYAWRIYNAIGSVNSNKFLRSHVQEQDNITKNDMVEFDDTGEWLLTACPIVKVRYNCWRYDFEFTHCGFDYASVAKRWNYVQGVAINLYRDTDFLSLFDNMRASEDKTGVSGGARE